MKFETSHVHKEMHLITPGVCARCQRLLRAGERVRLVYAGPVAEVMWTGGTPQKAVPKACVPAAKVNWFVEHENVDMCTEPR